MSTPAHRHRYVYLRQDTECSRGWGDRVLERKVFDVFFCESCLEYRRIHVLTEEPSSTELSSWITTWRRAA